MPRRKSPPAGGACSRSLDRSIVVRHTWNNVTGLAHRAPAPRTGADGMRSLSACLGWFGWGVVWVVACSGTAGDLFTPGGGSSGTAGFGGRGGRGGTGSGSSGEGGAG